MEEPEAAEAAIEAVIRAAMEEEAEAAMEAVIRAAIEEATGIQSESGSESASLSENVGLQGPHRIRVTSLRPGPGGRGSSLREPAAARRIYLLNLS
jgi:hypothetical protein